MAAALGLQDLGRRLPADRALDLGEAWNQHSPPRVRGFQDVGSSPPCLADGFLKFPQRKQTRSAGQFQGSAGPGLLPGFNPQLRPFPAA